MLGLFVLQTGIRTRVRLGNTLTSKRGSGSTGRLFGCISRVKCINCGSDASTEFGCSSGAKAKEFFSSGKLKQVCGNDEDVLEAKVVLVGATRKTRRC